MQQRADANVFRSQTATRWAHELEQMFADCDIGSIFGECVHAESLRARWRRITCPWQHEKGRIYISIGDIYFFFVFNLWRGVKEGFNFMECCVQGGKINRNRGRISCFQFKITKYIHAETYEEEQCLCLLDPLYAVSMKMWFAFLPRGLHFNISIQCTCCVLPSSSLTTWPHCWQKEYRGHG